MSLRRRISPLYVAEVLPQSQGQYAQAEPLYKRALAFRSNALQMVVCPALDRARNVMYSE